MTGSTRRGSVSTALLLLNTERAHLAALSASADTTADTQGSWHTKLWGAGSRQGRSVYFQ